MILWKISSLAITVALYAAAKRIHAKKPGLLRSPAILAPLGIVLLTLVFQMPFDAYKASTSSLTGMLDVVTVAFAIPLYRNWPILAANWRLIVGSLALGSLTAVLAGVVGTVFLGLGAEAAISVIPRSITMPVAVNLSSALGGTPELTAAFVMLTSFAGVFLGPRIIKRMRLRHPLAIGLMYGMGAHALGMVKAFEQGDLEGGSATLAVIAGALITVVWAYLFFPAVQSWLM
ncbi:LrgB family protein [Brevibacillus composti]|uniref:LrgB family protein n=1 Tax=Brevibacillus composti TaxID=2796470 RepID=A0A7T5EJU3_9BACL|nr:LrgB family protein [Brevibacillus composti]QQE73902.1 LrgB family protein [Brevibacillus composti]QUO40987.1 LrgB family protein [Brevibacillus composti]